MPVGVQCWPAPVPATPHLHHLLLHTGQSSPRPSRRRKLFSYHFKHFLFRQRIQLKDGFFTSVGQSEALNDDRVRQRRPSFVTEFIAGPGRSQYSSRHITASKQRCAAARPRAARRPRLRCRQKPRCQSFTDFVAGKDFIFSWRD